jgi:triosephosphate isomerase
LKKCLKHVSNEQAGICMISSEPAWAKGTGKITTQEIAEEARSFGKERLVKIVGEQLANSPQILDGGSMKAANAEID